ncbi:MAG: IS1595 family transposase, partial [Bacteroidota bacterium]
MTRRRSRLPRTTQLRLLEHFVAGTTARTAAQLVGVNRNTSILYYHKLRELIAERIADESPFGGEVEIDESYFGGRRKGPRGRGAAGKVVVFGILKRGGRVYTAVPPNLKRSTLLPIIRALVEPESVVYTDGFTVYDTLNAAGFEHYRVNHQEGYVDYETGENNGRLAHINGIENFPPADGGSASQAKRHLRRYDGIPRGHFELFLKECEWRFNYG